MDLAALDNISFESPVFKWGLYAITLLSSYFLLLKIQLGSLTKKGRFARFASLFYTVVVVCFCAFLFMFVPNRKANEEE